MIAKIFQKHTMEIKKRIYEIIEPAQNSDKHSKLFDICILTLIVLNTVIVILGSFSNIAAKCNRIFGIVELISVIIFTIEYLLRVITSKYKYHGVGFFKATIKYIKSPMAIIDLLAILPFYIPFLIRFDLRVLRILRLTRLLRILKINRYSKSLQILGNVLKRKKEELIITIFITFLLMLLASSIMFYVENEVQPEAFPNIIASFWWAIATLTTVGYGDIFPITALGKILAGTIAFLGIGLVALPTGIISSGFMEEYNNEQKKNKRKYRLSQKPKRKNYYRMRKRKKSELHVP